jgi:Protein of unknown function (DUF2892)
MRRNEGTIDRVVRLVLGVLALAGAFALGLGTVGGILAGVVGIVLLATAATGFCPLYAVLGVQTCPRRAAGR